MQYQTKFKAEDIDLPTLEALVSTMQAMTGKNITIEQTFTVVTDDVNLSSALDGLADSLKDRDGRKTIKVSAKKSRKPVKEQKPAIELGPRSLKNVDTGMIVSKVSLARELANGKMLEGEVYEDHTGQRWVVSNQKTVKEPQP